MKSVDNQLVLKGETTIDNADRWLQMKVATALLFHRNVHATKTKVTALNGTVNRHNPVPVTCEQILLG